MCACDIGRVNDAAKCDSQKREPDDDKVEAVPFRFPESTSLCFPEGKRKCVHCLLACLLV